MKKQFLVNGKVTYPQNGGAMTTFYFIQQETQESFSISTTEEAEAEALKLWGYSHSKHRKNADRA